MRVIIFGWISLLVLIGFACSAPSIAAQPTIDVNAIATSAAATVIARITRQAPTQIAMDAQKTVVAGLTRPAQTAIPTPDLSLIPPRGEYQHQATVAEDFDRFKNETTVTLVGGESERLSPNLGEWYLRFQYEGDAPTLPDEVRLEIDSKGRGLEGFTCGTLNFIADGVRLEGVSQPHFHANATGQTIWYAHRQIAIRDFLKMVSADSIEGQLCEHEFAFTPSQLEALRDFASRMQP